VSVLVLLLAACPSDPEVDSSNPTSPTDSAETDTATDSGTVPTGPDVCGSLGLPELAFQEADASADTYALAGDFTLPTTAGDWTLSVEWTGCDTYLFVPSEPRQNQGAPEATWALKRDNRSLVEALPANTHLFFVSSNRGSSADEEIAAIVEDYDEILADMEEADREWWTDRIHFVTAGVAGLDSWLGEALTSPGVGVGIDRTQRIREIGSMADPTRYNSSYGWFEPNIAFVAQEAVYYNAEALRDEHVANDGATVVHAWQGELLEDPGWAFARGFVDIELPDAATMATFDTLEFDHALMCVGVDEYGACPAWDYLTYAWLCDAEDPEVCDVEIGRWITTYWREGRWVHDVSGLLPLFKDGGTRRLAYWTIQPYEVWLDLRFSNQGKAARPAEVSYLWDGGTFDANWNANHPAIEIEVPADAVKVEIATVMSGHGMNSPNNCAEFCPTDHHFFVNGVEYVRDIPIENEETGCVDQVPAGTVPNQYGTWFYGRNGWCPGKHVDMVNLDVTDAIVPGAVNHLVYEAYQNGVPYAGSATMDVETWLVVSK